jgi:two-component system, OmpR family, sensor kinase
MAGMGETGPEARLLVVEDEPNILELLSASLRLAGFEVATATGGLEALGAVRRHRPDLVVLDVMLPDMGGSRDPAELDGLMRRIEDQAARMGRLVEDLLLLARLDQQRPLDRHPVDLLALAADAVHDARAVAPDRRIELVVGGEDGDPAGPALVVLGDDQRLRQVLANLVDNALTHTPAGGPIEVRVGASTLDGRPGAAVEVVDHGPGLAPGQAERVFERFYRADPARSHADGGTGLGLSIVAALVAVHGGTVGVDTVPGRGARFRVVLPLAPGAAG